MYKEWLEKVKKDKEKFDGQMQSSASPEQIARLSAEAQTKLKVSLPQAYLDFLRENNGLNWNGVMIYASEQVPIAGYTDRFIYGLVEMNETHRDDDFFNDFIVFGDDGMDLYAYNIGSGEYQIYENVPHNLVATYPNFDELISRALQRSLQ
jgi:hypothetical protein